MTYTTTTRRQLIAGAGIVSVALVAPTIAAAAQPDRLFAGRLAAFHAANARFLHTVNAKGNCPDDLADALCGAAGDAYLVLLATPAPDHAAVSAKLQAVSLWREGCELSREEFEQIAAEAAALLRREA